MNNLKTIYDMKLHNLSKVYNEQKQEDPTLLKATFIILELDVVSWNNELITEEEGIKMASSMKHKPLLCQYFKTDDYENPNDHFGSHGATVDKFRKGGEEIKATNTFAIGVSSDEGCYVSEIEEDGIKKKVLMCDYYLWVSRYLNVCSLIEDIYNSDADLFSSCEYLYKDYEVIDGVTYPKNIIFEGHCLLGSREDGSIVEPAFDVSKLTKFNEKWKKALNEINNKEEENMEINKESWIKAICELSHGDIKNGIYDALSKVMTADEYYGIWISNYNIYDDYFIYEKYEGKTYKYYKINYSKTDDTVTVDIASKKEVKWGDIWVEVAKQEETVGTLNSKIDTLTNEKAEIQIKYNEAAETVTALNEEVNKLKPIVETYEKEQFEKKLNEKINFYKNKFVSLNAKDKFETEEVQELIKKSINEIDAKEKLNDMLIDLVPIIKSNNAKNETNIGGVVKELSNKIENLIPEESVSFEDRYLK